MQNDFFMDIHYGSIIGFRHLGIAPCYTDGLSLWRVSDFDTLENSIERVMFLCGYFWGHWLLNPIFIGLAGKSRSQKRVEALILYAMFWGFMINVTQVPVVYVCL